MTRLAVGAVHLGNESAPGSERVAFAVQLMEEAAERGAKVLVLPELAWSNLAILAKRGVTAGDVALYQQAVVTLRQFAQERACAVVAPALPAALGGGHHNGAVVIDEDGQPSCLAHKNTLPTGPGMDESILFTTGAGWCVAPLAHTRLGVLICADRRNPDHWRALSAQGAEIVAVLVAGCGDDEPGMVLAELRTYARLAGVHAVMACRAGTDVDGSLSIDHHAESCVVISDGTVLGHPRTTGRSSFSVGSLDIGAAQPVGAIRP